MAVLIIQDTAPSRRPRIAARGAGRLLRIEMRHNVMLWMLPVAVALFWYQAYRHVMALPAMWNLRTMSMQNDALLDFAMPVAGAAAWMGWRESRRGVTETLTSTARARWARNLGTWAATTGWALAGYLACVSVVYGITARQDAWGGPLWWPAIVGVAGIPALSAFGFAAGALFPSRFTTPLVTLLAFFGLGFGTPAAQGRHSFWLVSPLVSGSADVGADPGVATFYPYLPDLAIAQVMFLAGAVMALLGILGLPARSGGWRLRACAAVLAVSGLATAGTAAGLVHGTARLDAHGMTVIPALHDAASDQPVPYNPVCGGTVPVCLHPAYAAYLPAVTGALEPVLGQLSGLPGVPARLSQVAQVYLQGPGNEIRLPVSNAPSEFTLPDPRGLTASDFTRQLDASVAFPVVSAVLGVTQRETASPAQQAILSALTGFDAGQSRDLGVEPAVLPRPGSAAAAAARRFAALPAATRHAWLAAHLPALRAGRVTLAEFP